MNKEDGSMEVKGHMGSEERERREGRSSESKEM